MCNPRKVLRRVGVWGKVPEQCFHWPPQGTVQGNGLISDDEKFKKNLLPRTSQAAQTTGREVFLS